MEYIEFNCELCGAVKKQKACWHKERKHHFCSRLCANRFNAKSKSSGMTKREYEKWYWSKPENAERRKKMSKASHIARMASLGKSLKFSLISRARQRAEKQNIPFDLKIDDFEIPSHCPILGIELAVWTKQGGNYRSPSLDKIIPELGYVKGNVQVISKRANSIKSDASLEEIIAVAKWAEIFLQKHLQSLDRQSTDNAPSLAA